MSSVRPFAPEDSMDNVHVIDLPVAPADTAEALERGGADTAECDDPAPIESLCRKSFEPIKDAAHANTNVDWRPSRGFMNGILLAVPLWGLIGLVTWFVLAW
jgi:hypothetical protein